MTKLIGRKGPSVKNSNFASSSWQPGEGAFRYGRSVPTPVVLLKLRGWLDFSAATRLMRKVFSGFPGDFARYLRILTTNPRSILW